MDGTRTWSGEMLTARTAPPAPSHSAAPASSAAAASTPASPQLERPRDLSTRAPIRCCPSSAAVCPISARRRRSAGPGRSLRAAANKRTASARTSGFVTSSLMHAACRTDCAAALARGSRGRAPARGASVKRRCRAAHGPSVALDTTHSQQPSSLAASRPTSRGTAASRAAYAPRTESRALHDDGSGPKPRNGAAPGSTPRARPVSIVPCAPRRCCQEVPTGGGSGGAGGSSSPAGRSARSRLSASTSATSLQLVALKSRIATVCALLWRSRRPLLCPPSRPSVTTKSTRSPTPASDAVRPKLRSSSMNVAPGGQPSTLWYQTRTSPGAAAASDAASAACTGSVTTATAAAAIRRLCTFAAASLLEREPLQRQGQAASTLALEREPSRCAGSARGAGRQKRRTVERSPIPTPGALRAPR